MTPFFKKLLCHRWKMHKTGFHAILYWAALLAALLLSVASQMKICSSACSATADFSIFGMEFGWFGILFFISLASVSALAKRFPPFAHLAMFMLFSAAGAEARFIWIQKYEIGEWCTICLSIAATVFIAASAMIYEKYADIKHTGGTMKFILKQFPFISIAFIIGMTAAILGVGRGDAGAAPLNQFLGKQDSDVTVYFVSDWFCPVCQKIESRIEEMFPEVARRARVGFVDMPVHRETLNFTPYNLQFIFHEKEKYIQLRKELSLLALRTRNPSRGDVQNAVMKHGVKLREVDYADILNGMQADQAVCRDFKVKFTPSVVITASGTGRSKVLVGDKEISLTAIIHAINSVRSRK